MKTDVVRQWMKDNKITQEELAAEIGYSHRVTVATNLRKGKDEVSPEFLGRLVARYPDIAQMLHAPTQADADVQPESA